MECSFCNYLEKNYEPDSEKDFICSRCAQVLISAQQEDLRRAYEKAIEKGYLKKAEAIESFLIPEESFDGQRKPITKKRRRHTHRKRIIRTIRDKKKRIG